MKQYLIVFSRNSSEAGDFHDFVEFVIGLAREGGKVSALLVQNAVFSARQSAMCSAAKRLVQNGVDLLADSFALSERGIDPGRLKDGIRPATLDCVIDRLADGAQVIWH